MADADKVRAALQKMDPNNDNQWTMQGEAQLATVHFLSGDKVSREELKAIAPEFNRETLRAFRASEGAKNVQPPAPEVDDKDQEDGITGVGAQSSIAEPGEVAGRQAGREMDIEALAEEIRLANEEIEQARMIEHEAKTRAVDLQHKVSRLNNLLHRLQPPQTN